MRDQHDDDGSIIVEWGALIAPFAAYAAMRVLYGGVSSHLPRQRLPAIHLTPAMAHAPCAMWRGSSTLALACAGVVTSIITRNCWVGPYDDRVCAAIVRAAPACRVPPANDPYDLGVAWAMLPVVFTVRRARYVWWRRRWTLECEQKSHACEGRNGVRYRRFVHEQRATHGADFVMCVTGRALRNLVRTTWCVRAN